MATVVISDELLQQAKQAAITAGYASPDLLIEEAIAQKIESLRSEASDRLTQHIRERMISAGLSEEEILADFEEFRQSLYKEAR